MTVNGDGEVSATQHVVALVAARNEATTVGTTVSALNGLSQVDRVLVVDDASRDATADVARAAGATVLHLPRNRGKGGAVSAGVGRTPDADVYLLVDGDVGASAVAARALLAPVLSGEADMTVGVLPAAGGRGGFGLVRDLSAAGSARATGWRPEAPLSGQRAVRGELLRSIDLAPGFGLETALNIDAKRAGARVVEVPVVMEHRHTGRGPRGFIHRAAQGAAVARALWPRLTSSAFRITLIVAVTVLALGLALWSGNRWEPASVAPTSRADKVVVFGMPHLAWSDIGHGELPNLDRLERSGAVAAMSVRTVSHNPSLAEGYATLGAGTRVSANGAAGAAYDASAPLENGTAAQAVTRLVGRPAHGQVVAFDGPAIVRANQGQHLSSLPGALGEAMQKAGRGTAAVGNADIGAVQGRQPVTSRPAALAVMDGVSAVNGGAVEPGDVLSNDPASPFGQRADAEKVVTRTTAALQQNDLVVIDTGDTDRALAVSGQALTTAAAEARRQALVHTDDILGRVEKSLPPRTLLLVVSVVPPDTTWHLTPVVASGAGVVKGYLQSESTDRLGLVTLTDVAPTILDSLHVAVPDGMIGHPLRFHPGSVDLGRLSGLDHDGTTRDAIYPGIALGFVLLHAAVYLVAALLLARRDAGRSEPFLRYGVLAIAALPVATFLVKALPLDGGASLAVMFGIDALIVAIAGRARRHALSPLAWVMGFTAVVLMIDVATGARLQVNSVLGYSPQTAARFFGIGNSAFAVLAATGILAAAVHLQYAQRRREALVTVAAFLALLIVVDGAPSLGG
ncbi:MAG: glycosyltransferase, partial [Acidimicrobiia bacterium]|nr:glycosyltransferase [Acidimicrobiia bacterium]